MLYIFIVICFIGVIGCFKCPKGFLVDEVNIRVLDYDVPDCNLDQLDDKLEDLMDVSKTHDTLFGNFDDDEEDPIKDMEDISAGDIMERGKE